MKAFPHRPTIFAGFAAIHVFGFVLASANAIVARAVSGSVYLPLNVLHGLGMPVFADSHGLRSPSALGWALAIMLWTGVWWTIASVTVAVFKSTPANSDTKTPR